MLYNNMCIVAACFIADLYLVGKASFEAQPIICNNANLTEQVQGIPPSPSDGYGVVSARQMQVVPTRRVVPYLLLCTQYRALIVRTASLGFFSWQLLENGGGTSLLLRDTITSFV